MAVVFSADDGIHGQELWISNGTADGTRLLKDISPAGSGATSWSINPIGGNVVFTATDGTISGIWATDGTSTGTMQLAELHTANSAGTHFAQAGDKVFLTVQGSVGRELWVTNGTAVGTEFLTGLNGRPVYGPGGIAAVGDKFVFTNADATHGYEPWVTDGTQAGTHILKDILDSYSEASSYPRSYTSVGNQVAFSTDFGGLYVTDGTSEGTILIIPDNRHVDARWLAEAGGNLVFAAITSNGLASQLWASDGTAVGTHLIKAFIPDASTWTTEQSAIYDHWQLTMYGFAHFGDKLLFTVDRDYDRDTGATGSNTGVWITDGTTDGTIQLGGPNVVYDFTVLRDKVIFSDFSDYGLGGQVWVTDGTAAGTHALGNVYAPLASTPGTPLMGRSGTSCCSWVTTARTASNFG